MGGHCNITGRLERWVATATKRAGSSSERLGGAVHTAQAKARQWACAGTTDRHHAGDEIGGRVCDEVDHGAGLWFRLVRRAAMTMVAHGDQRVGALVAVRATERGGHCFFHVIQAIG